MQKLSVLLLFVFSSSYCLSSGTFITPPPRPKVDCKLEENKEKPQCVKEEVDK